MNKKKVRLPRIGITIGDYNGIGPEIILKLFTEAPMLQRCIPVVFGHRAVLDDYAKRLNISYRYHHYRPDKGWRGEAINFYLPEEAAREAKDFKPEILPGKPTEASGKYAVQSLQWAIEGLKAGLVEALVTAPISKAAIRMAGTDEPAHTEMLAEAFGKHPDEVLMTFVADDVKVALTTTHIPLQQVPRTLSDKLLLKKIEVLLQTLREDFDLSRPRIAVCGLNPHAGEQGTLGREEVEWIGPLIEKLQQQGHDVMGPYPADGLWGSGLWSKFDAIMALYHDQGLIPFKFLARDRGVNYTAGLPVIRTSPTHGTAYAIAGQGKADPSSFRHAVWMALDLIAHRKKKTAEAEAEEKASA